MIFIRVTFTILLTFLLTQCKSSLNDAFKTVEKSLETTNRNLGNSLENLYSSIDSNRQKNLVLGLKADSIFYANDIACKLMDSLKLAMQLQDISGADLSVATNIFVNSLTGDTLKEKLVAVYRYSYSSLIDNSKKRSLDSVLNSIGMLKFDNTWERKYFESTSTVAAITILSKFQNDCKNAAILCLSDIKDHLPD
jgi:hypothetical protein